jgi:formyltetrahydrofolate-dependent phosphoribosylglycinamide formyltransferase
MTMRTAVLASGGGSNLGALLAHLDTHAGACACEIVLVSSERAGAGALARAAERSIPTMHLVDPRDGDRMDAILREHRVELIVLAGYLKLVPPAVTRRFRGRMMNVHPTLLPAFGGAGMYGIRAHQAVIDAGVSLSGATVHFVDEVYDRGAIIAQWPVPVIPGDSAQALAARVLRIEHLLYPRAIEAVAAERIRLDDEGRVHRPIPDASTAFSVAPTSDASLGRSIDALFGA